MKLRGIFLIGLLSLTLSAQASLPKAQSFMSELIDLAQLSKDKAGARGDESAKIIKNLSSQVDFEALAKLALGSRWAKYPAKQKQNFLSTLQELLEVVVYPQAKKISAKKDDLHYTPSAKNAREVKVTGKIEHEKKGEIIQDEIDIVLIYAKAAKDPKIVDAILDGEKVSANLKRQFDNALKKQSFAQIIDKMKKRVNEAKANTQASR
jgi:ABC-type transporter MlaC component